MSKSKQCRKDLSFSDIVILHSVVGGKEGARAGAKAGDAAAAAGEEIGVVPVLSTGGGEDDF